MPVEIHDESGKPRQRTDVEAALRALEAEIVRNPMACGVDGKPLIFHYVVIVEVLKALLGRL